MLSMCFALGAAVPAWPSTLSGHRFVRPLPQIKKDAITFLPEVATEDDHEVGRRLAARLWSEMLGSIGRPGGSRCLVAS